MALTWYIVSDYMWWSQQLPSKSPNSKIRKETARFHGKGPQFSSSQN